MGMLKITMIVLLLLMPAWSPATPGDLDFFVIQPGQPGSAEEARPVMSALADYLERQLKGETAVEGAYFNMTEEALEALKPKVPTWGIVSLGFFIEYGARLDMYPIASTRPGGKSHERWYLLVARGGPQSWQQVAGTVLGTMLYQPQSAARLMFAVEPDKLPFALEGTSSPLRALRDVARGQAAGVILDYSQYQALQALPLFKDLEVITRSEPLPTAPVVSFGPPGERERRISEILQQMKQDPAAQNLLQLLQTDGFGPPDPGLGSYVGNGKK
ncbi:MAG: PhnD/SsuA/transferrin family substrate-binding protein [Syntrophotaleaceae bacterium]